MADNANERLDLYLGQWYAASIGRGNPAQAEAAFRDLVGADAQFRAAAQARLKSIHPEVIKRDHVSKVSADILRRVLT